MGKGAGTSRVPIADVALGLFECPLGADSNKRLYDSTIEREG
jgi:hypothetical protein